jgi:hypothetical protein
MPALVTGLTFISQAALHIGGGAKKVIISAPPKAPMRID